MGVVQATRRLVNLGSWQQTLAIAEFARRREAQFEAAIAAGCPVGRRLGEFPGEELTMELVSTGPYTSGRIATAVELTGRLPLTLAGMEAGVIDLERACAIASRTLSMSDADAAYADRVLSAAAPGLRLDQVARRAAALEEKLAPAAVKARRELARKLDQRVEARREDSGNASLAGRELDPVDVLASKAHIDALAARLRGAGFAGTIGALRALVLTDLTQGRDPRDRITAGAAPEPAGTLRDDAASPGDAPTFDGEPGHGEPGHGEPGHGEPGYGTPSDGAPDDGAPDDGAPGHREPSDGTPSDDAPDNGGELAGEPPEEDLADGGSRRRGPGGPAGRVPLPAPDPVPAPALINLLVPAGTLLGWGSAPAEVGGWGLLNAEETRTMVQAASQHPRTRWCMTIIAPDGTAIAHGCARGRHLRGMNPPPATPPGNAPPHAASLLDLLRRLNITLEPIAGDTCDHAHAEDRYLPSRKLRHLIHARNHLCTAPGCNRQAVNCDLDHGIPYPDGLSCECNLSPKCRRHHRVKQAAGWQVTQPTPGTATWTTPSGRTHTTTATVYDV